MYLRRIKCSSDHRYVLRQSYWDGSLWKHRDLMDLGVNPSDYIEYAGRNGFYFCGGIEERLQDAGVHYSSEDLETLFLPFLEPHVRRIIEGFQARSSRSCRAGKPARDEMIRKQCLLHSFDKRRLHYLRCGRVDIGDLDRGPWSFLNALAEKSRDEIEHTLEGMEAVLRPHEMRPYLFAALNLQAYFPHHLLKNCPGAIDQEMVDHEFLEALCRVNRDETFFAATEAGDHSALHPYLVRYVILYFDTEPERSRWPGFTNQFAGRQRPHRGTVGVQGMAMDEACRVFGVSRDQAAGMEKRELIRIYRRKAKELHPDKGGDKESFIRMGQAFALLMEKRGR